MFKLRKRTEEILNIIIKRNGLNLWEFEIFGFDSFTVDIL